MPKVRKMTRKMKQFADELLSNKDITPTDAAERAYGVATRNAAAVIAHENMNKPLIQAYLDKHDYDSQVTIVEMMQQREDKRLAFDAAKDIQDRVHGRATQKVEQTTTGVTLNIDLTSSLEVSE